MNIFKSKAEKELDSLISEMRINLENNYKDTAHNARIKLGKRTEELHAEGKLKEAKYNEYRRIFEHYTILLKNYHH